MTTVIQFPERASQPLTDVVSGEIRALMGRHGVTQVALAEWLGMKQASVSARLNGDTRWTLPEIERIAEGFAVHPAELMGGHATGPRPNPDGGLPILEVRHQGLEPRTLWLRGFAADLQELPGAA